MATVTARDWGWIIDSSKYNPLYRSRCHSRYSRCRRRGGRGPRRRGSSTSTRQAGTLLRASYLFLTPSIPISISDQWRSCRWRCSRCTGRRTHTGLPRTGPQLTWCPPSRRPRQSHCPLVTTSGTPLPTDNGQENIRRVQICPKVKGAFHFFQGKEIHILIISTSWELRYFRDPCKYWFMCYHCFIRQRPCLCFLFIWSD